MLHDVVKLLDDTGQRRDLATAGALVVSVSGYNYFRSIYPCLTPAEMQPFEDDLKEFYKSAIPQNVSGVEWDYISDQYIE
ncbi:hypothetical protein V5O48_016914 [Marasmius crinis-equi]|uniref:Uncharacterized protein n=1 Tax=Marasmius crinis-equi TaxID=585013 RepID=A0ABR3EQN5_9AGAR